MSEGKSGRCDKSISAKIHSNLYFSSLNKQLMGRDYKSDSASNKFQHSLLIRKTPQMILNKITVENFKGIKKPVTITLKPITLLFGQNSSGKSSIIQALNYARQIFIDGELIPDIQRNPERGLDFGGYKNIVHNQNLDQPIVFNFQLDDTSGFAFTDFTSNSINLAAEHTDIKPETLYMKSRIIKRNYNRLIDKGVEYESELAFIGNQIKKINVKIFIKWNDELKIPYINLYEVSANGDPLFQIYRDKEFKETTWLSMYNNTILPKYFLEHIDHIKSDIEFRQSLYDEGEIKSLQEEYEERKELYEKGELQVTSKEWDEYEEYIENIHKENEKFRHACIGRKKTLKDGLLFEGEEVFQSTILPNSEELIIIPPESSLFLDYHRDYKNQNISFFRHMVSMFVTTPIRALKFYFQGFNHIGPLRELPKRNHVSFAPNNFSRWVTGIAAYDVLLDKNTPKEIIEETNKWLSSKNHFNTGYRIEVKRNKFLDMDTQLFQLLSKSRELNNKVDEIQDAIENMPEQRNFSIRDISQDISLAVQDVGTGISQILPIIIGSLYLKACLICIEQPELHIHPALQAEMADLFISQIPEIAQFVIETHSEHLMLRILRRIRNTKENEGCQESPIYPDDVAVYYLVKDENITDAIHIPITEDGEFLLPWPHGFFPERAKELFS